MYKLLLSWRYLRTRFIALASIVSVTLGVATLIVVNSVMAGFVDQMKNRLHGILSDIEIEAPLMSDIPDPELHADVVRQIIGDDLQDLTCVVRSHALLSFEFHGRPWTQHVILLGIDDETFGKVTDFEPYLTNEIKKERFNFTLEETGYTRFDRAGWPYRREKAQSKRDFDRMMREHDQLYNQAAQQYVDNHPLQQPDGSPATQSAQNNEPVKFEFAPLPAMTPNINNAFPVENDPSDANDLAENQTQPPQHLPGQTVMMSPFDPHAHLRDKVNLEDLFDPMRDQHAGIVLGMAISEKKSLDEDGNPIDVHMLLPGDDVQMMFLSAGQQMRAVSEEFTVVDFYSSNMHEYDSSFAFVPLSKLQKLRGMVDPLSKVGSVSAIQIKLKAGADLDAVRDKLKAEFPGAEYYDIRTWQDTQRPLLSAVQLELTILNILLFLIIAVAGFGILATFFMIVVEKTRDIGILKALGAPSGGVMSIFLGYGMSLGIVGTGVGIVLGLVFVNYINQVADLVGWLTGREVFDPQFYFFSEIPTIVSPTMVLLVALGAIMIAVLASVLPALRAARLHPVEALRYE
ncbi:MAG: FtsX-like permease family protein [Planctomycetota bacterium]